MSVAQDLIRHYAEVRNRLRFPPNAVPDTGINLRRNREAPPPKEPPKIAIRTPRLTQVEQQRVETYRVSFCRKDVSFRTVLTITAENFGISYKDITLKTRRVRYVFPRQVACFLANKYIDQSLSSMGRFLGLDHTSVLHGRDKVAKMMETDHPICEQIKIIEDRIFESFTRSYHSALHQPIMAVKPGPGSQVQPIFSVDNSNGSTSSVSEERSHQDVAGELHSPTTDIPNIPETA